MMETVVEVVDEDDDDVVVRAPARRSDTTVVITGVDDADDDAFFSSPAIASPPPPLPPLPPSSRTVRTPAWIRDASRAFVEAVGRRDPRHAARLWTEVVATDLEAEEAQCTRRERDLVDAFAEADGARGAWEAGTRRGKQTVELAYRCAQTMDAAAALRREHARAHAEIDRVGTRLLRLARPYAATAWHDRIAEVVDDEARRAREATDAALRTKAEALARDVGEGRDEPHAPEASPYAEALASACERRAAVRAVRVVTEAATRCAPALFAV